MGALLTRRPRGWWWNEDAADGATSDCCGGVDVEAAGDPGWLDAVADSGDVVRALPPVTARTVSEHVQIKGPWRGRWLLEAPPKGGKPQPQLGATAGPGAEAGTGTDLTALPPRRLQLSLLILLLAVLRPLWPLWPWLSGGPIAAGGCFLWLVRAPSPASASLPTGRSQSSFRVSEKRRARSRCRVSGRKRLAGDSRRDGDLSTVKYREEKWAEALIFDVCLVPSTFKGVEKEEPFLRMEPDYLMPEAPEAEI
ncbi:hypothetical protein HDV63DRAFT_410368 [Trichoderma sp. SZMC 28014]